MSQKLYFTLCSILTMSAMLVGKRDHRTFIELDTLYDDFGQICLNLFQ